MKTVGKFLGNSTPRRDKNVEYTKRFLDTPIVIFLKDSTPCYT